MSAYAIAVENVGVNVWVTVMGPVWANDRTQMLFKHWWGVAPKGARAVTIFLSLVRLPSPPILTSDHAYTSLRRTFSLGNISCAAFVETPKNCP
jgi:hypothetical protein